MSLDDLRERPDRRAVVVPALFFVAGFIAVFVLLGASATLLGALLQRYQIWLARIGGAVIIILGLHLAGAFRLLPLMRERRLQLTGSPISNAGAFLTGSAFGVGWTPCYGPILAALLTLGMTRETLGGGMLLLTAYGIGLGVPFVVAALATGRFLNAYSRMRRFIPVVEKVSGALLIVMGLLLVTDTLTILSAWLQRATPAFLFERL